MFDAPSFIGRFLDVCRFNTVIEHGLFRKIYITRATLMLLVKTSLLKTQSSTPHAFPRAGGAGSDGPFRTARWDRGLGIGTSARDPAYFDQLVFLIYSVNFNKQKKNKKEQNISNRV